MFKNCYEITISCVDLQDEDLAVDRFCPHVVRVIDIRIRSCVWKESENGRVLWDDNCHFIGYVMGPPRPSGADECGRICLAYGAGPQARPPCTHFTHADGMCYLKRNIKGWKEIDENGSTCGFIRGGSAQSLD
jgi:hypothetical protein